MIYAQLLKYFSYTKHSIERIVEQLLTKIISILWFWPSEYLYDSLYLELFFHILKNGHYIFKSQVCCHFDNGMVLFVEWHKEDLVYWVYFKVLFTNCFVSLGSHCYEARKKLRGKVIHWRSLYGLLVEIYIAVPKPTAAEFLQEWWSSGSLLKSVG